MPESRLKAVIWDMDGVIADTGAYHYQAWRKVFQERGFEFTEEDFQRHFGQRNDTIIRDVIGMTASPGEIDAIAAEKEADYRRRVDGNIKPLPGALELLKSITEHHLKTAIASSAPMENIQLIIRGLGIDKCFQAIVWGREVSEGKPSPQVYLLAAGKLGVNPKNCVVLEDAVAGVAGAKKAGMKCVAITNTHPRGNLKEADLVVDTLEAISVNNLTALFNRRSEGSVDFATQSKQ